MSKVGQATKSETGRMKSGHAKEGYKIVYAAVPDQVFKHAKAQAILAGMTWANYVSEVLANATPAQLSTHGPEVKT